MATGLGHQPRTGLAMPAADQITAAFIPGVSVIIADLTSAARCDRSTIRNLLKAHQGSGVFRECPYLS